MAQSKKDFLAFLENTLVPDLRSDGSTASARDLMDCVLMAEQNRTSATKAAFFRQVARDYKASGSTGMARDYARCARLVSPRRKRN
jgi:hypothetical protein